MSKKYIVLFVFVLSLMFTSCVSKKKFLEMQDGRLKAEALSRQLDEANKAKANRIEVLIKDFEFMKNDLLESNAIKDHYIDSLNGQIYLLSDNLSLQKESLQETSFNLDFEKQRLTNAIQAKDRTIGSLQSKIDQLESTISAKNSVIDQKNYDIGQLKEQTKVLEGKIQTGENSLGKLQQQLEKSKADATKIQSQLNEKDATISKLQNQVKLLKDQIGG